MNLLNYRLFVFRQNNHSNWLKNIVKFYKKMFKYCQISDFLCILYLLTSNLKNLKMGKFLPAHYTLFSVNIILLFFAVRVLWSRRRLFCDYNIVKAMEPPTTTYTDFPWHCVQKHQIVSNNYHASYCSTLFYRWSFDKISPCNFPNLQIVEQEMIKTLKSD